MALTNANFLIVIITIVYCLLLYYYYDAHFPVVCFQPCCLGAAFYVPDFLFLLLDAALSPFPSFTFSASSLRQSLQKYLNLLIMANIANLTVV